jgi:hypothetical protein
MNALALSLLSLMLGVAVRGMGVPAWGAGRRRSMLMDGPQAAAKGMVTAKR